MLSLALSVFQVKKKPPQGPHRARGVVRIPATAGGVPQDGSWSQATVELGSVESVGRAVQPCLVGLRRAVQGLVSR